MAERMNSERMVETCSHECVLEDSADISRFDGLRRNSSAMRLENKVVAGESLLEDAKQEKQLFRNGYDAVFLSLALIYEKLLSFKADVNPFEAANLAHS